MDHFFYSNQIYDNVIILDENEAIHLIKVLRLKSDDKVSIVDGRGNLYHASIISEDINDCKLNIISIIKEFNLKKHYIHLAIAPPKSHDRLEFFVEKAVELGINEISFIISNHSERNNVKLNRIQKCTISAMKQSRNAYLPKVNDIVDYGKFINHCNNSEKFIAHMDFNNIHLQCAASKDSDYCVLIGPEGDFSNDEIEQSIINNFRKISLGKSRLRTETAAISACHILNLINE